MPNASGSSRYVLGSTDDEHERLIRQATLFDPFTERLLIDAGLGPGQHVLDIGCGLGDVSMLLARLVGATGRILGIDNDPSIIAKANDRVAEAGFQNVSFLESEVCDVPSGEPFDAIVGRLILQFLPDPGTVVRSLVRSLRPGGVLAIQDACWAPLLQLSGDLPLRSKCTTLMCQALQRSGAKTDMQLVLYQTFQDAGLPPPRIRMEVPIGDDPELTRWVYDLFCSLLPQMRRHRLPFDSVGQIGTLHERLDAELAAMKTFGATIGLVGAWSRKPKEE